MSKTKLCANNISFTYPKRDVPALRNISFSLYENEWVTIIGKNGSGKSTFGKIMNGLLLPDEGSMTVDEQIVLSEETVWDIRKKVGMVFQNPDNQFVGTTVIDDIAFGLENIGTPRDVMTKRIQMVLKQVGMEEYQDVEPHLLSGGQKQRVAIAGILAVQPDILVLDEATSMLDPKGRKEVLHTVQALRKAENISVISITHDLEEAIYADRVIVLHEGKILREGTPREIFKESVLLQNIGLDVPFSIKLSLALQKQGINLSEGHLTMEGLVTELCELHLKK